MQQAQQLQLFTQPNTGQELADARKQIARLDAANLALSIQNKALRMEIDRLKSSLDSQNSPKD